MEAARGVCGGEPAPEKKTKLKLYSYWRSSCSCRVRIALNLKGLEYEYIPVNLQKGEQWSEEFSKVNPMNYVPVLVDEDIVLTDSFAILLYLEERYPQHPLLPGDLKKRAINYQVSSIVSSSIQPLQNLSVLKFVEEKGGPDEPLKWAQYHVGRGLSALEKLLADHAGKYATGEEPYLADVFLAPQLDGAVRRFSIDMSQFPILSRLMEAYGEIRAFQDAMPLRQPDAPKAQS